jgi:hypothetical protein
MKALAKLALLALAVLTSACRAILRNPVPEKYPLDATVLDRSNLRFWGDRRDQAPRAIFLRAEEGTLEEHFDGILRREHNYHSISVGPDYDEPLEKVYTTLDTSRIILRRSIFSINKVGALSAD